MHFAVADSKIAVDNIEKHVISPMHKQKHAHKSVITQLCVAFLRCMCAFVTFLVEIIILIKPASLQLFYHITFCSVL